MKLMKRWIQGICAEGPFEGCPVLNDESDGTFYIIKDTQDNVAHLCDKLNKLSNNIEHYNDLGPFIVDDAGSLVDMSNGNVYDYFEEFVDLLNDIINRKNGD